MATSGSVTSPSSGSGYPYPNVFIIEWWVTGNGSNYHNIHWKAWCGGGASNYYQYIFNASGWLLLDGGSSYLYYNYHNQARYHGEVLAEGDFTIWHTEAKGFGIQVGGGYYYSSTFVSSQEWWTLPALASAPTGINGYNNTTDGTENRATATVYVGSWGNASSGSYLIVSRYQSRDPFGEWAAVSTGNTSANMNWTPNKSTNVSAGAISVWYPEALNNNSLYSFAGAKYVVSPSAPVITTTSSNSRTTTPSCTVTYRGGESNSSSADSVSMSKYRLYLDGTLKQTVSTSGKNATFSALGVSDFSLGNNHTIKITATNSIGATSENSKTLNIPTGVSGIAVSNQPRQITFVGSNTGGGSGRVVSYKVRYNTDKTALENGTYTETDFFASEITVSGVALKTKYYYQVVAYNEYGLSAKSTTLSISTMDLYSPVFGSFTVSKYSTIGIKVEISITETGGNTRTSAQIVRTVFQYRQGSEWNTLGTVEGSQTNPSVTKTGFFSSAGLCSFRAITTNSDGMSTTSQILYVYPPTPISVENIQLASPISFLAKLNVVNPGTAFSNQGATFTGLDVYKYELWVNGVEEKTEIVTSAYRVQLESYKHLRYNTSYTMRGTVYNTYGLWDNSSDFSGTTAKRQSAYVVSKNGTTKQIAQISDLTRGTSSDKAIERMYYIKKNALCGVQVDDDKTNTVLRFPTDFSLYYDYEASDGMIVFENGKALCCALILNDNNEKDYVMGIYDSESDMWNKFFCVNGEWQDTCFVLTGTGWTVSEIFKGFYDRQYYDSISQISGFALTQMDKMMPNEGFTAEQIKVREEDPIPSGFVYNSSTGLYHYVGN